MKKIILSLLLACFVASVGFAQKTKLTKANTEFENHNYSAAIELYLEILDKENISEAKVKLAESYRKLNNMKEAEFWYGQVVHLPEAKPIDYLHYGKALQANGKCDLARPWFKKYSAAEPDDLRGQLLSNTCDLEALEKMLKSRKDFYEIKQLPFNTAFDDFGPTFYKGNLLFASERNNKSSINRIHEWSGYPFLDLLITKVDTIDAETLDFKYDEAPEKYSNRLNTKYHSGPICFSQDEKTVFFTHNDSDERNRLGRNDETTIRLKVFTADIDGDKWTNIEGLPFNSDEYSVAYPALDVDGKTLYFSSDMPGGFGGMDLYYTVKENGQWLPPRNLGPRINTEGHEVFPYVHSSGRLYFSSDGHVGLGMLDVYYIDNNNGVWESPMNVGYPINTPSDDFGLIMNKEETFGYFCSNRKGGTGRTDIYSFKYSIVKVEVLVYDENTNQPINDASVLNDCSGLEMFTGDNGRVTIELPLNRCCTFTAGKEDYTKNTSESCTYDYKASTKVFVKIALSQSMNFAIEGVVYDEETGDPLTNSSVVVTPDCGGEAIEVKTDESGRYRFTLDSDCCYSLKAAHEGYFSVSTDQPYCTKGLGKSQTFTHNFALQRFINPPGDLVTDENNPSFYPCDGIGRSFVIRHIYYDFDKAYIRTDAEEPLFQLIKILEDNPDLVVEIGSHTDARGSNRYNIRLSARRAESVVKYLINQGIDESRLQAKGYGETDPTNDCVDEIPCTEEQHQRNRRTEFRVIGKIDGTRYDCENDILDVNQTSVEPKELIKVDKCKNCPF